MNSASELFNGAMIWLRDNYMKYRFFTERDVVWTLQLRIEEVIREEGLPYRVFNDYGVAPRTRADLVLRDADATIDLAAEFKYEPSHDRKVSLGGDIMDGKFPVVFWKDPSGSVGKDITRVREFVESGLVKEAQSVFIDEGGYFLRREPFEGAEWKDWGEGVSVLWASFRS